MTASQGAGRSQCAVAPATLSPRSRPVYGASILLVIALGLLTRKFPEFVPAALGKTPGDALWLWALMVFLGLGWIFRRARTVTLALAALSFSFAIEFLQLYHAPWIETLRGTLLGRLVLGRGFLWGDLVAYCVGVAVGGLGEMGLRKAYRRWHRGQ